MSQQQDYYSEVYSTARELGFNEVQAHMAATQASLETGYGRSVKGNNHFGIKAGKSWSGPTVNFATKEEVNGKMVGQRDNFRGYRDMRDSIMGYGTFMSNAFPETWNAKDFNSAVNGLANGKYGNYATDSRYGAKLGNINETFGKGVPAVGLSSAVIDALTQNQDRQYASIPVDTSWEALGSMPSMPGIDGLAVADRGGVPSPSAKRDNPSNPSFPDNAVGPLAERMGSYDAPVSTVAELMGALGAPTSQNQQGLQATATATQGVNPSHQASVTANVSNAFGPTAPTGVAGVPTGRFDQAFSAFDNGVPTGRFDQAFNAFGAPNQSTAATTTGLPALDAPQTIASRPEAIGYQAPEALTSQQEEKSKDKEKDPYEFSPLGKAAFIGGMVTNPLATLATTAATNVARGRPVNAGMGLGFGGLGGLGGIFDGSPSANTQALGYASDMALGNPGTTQQDFLANYMGAMRGFTGNPNIDPFGGLPRDGRVAAYNAALRDQGLAIGLMEGFSRDLGGAFGGFGGGNSGSGGGRGGSPGGGGRGGMGGRETGSYGADG